MLLDLVMRMERACALVGRRSSLSMRITTRRRAHSLAQYASKLGDYGFVNYMDTTEAQAGWALADVRRRHLLGVE
jgi:hypothetical protein